MKKILTAALLCAVSTFAAWDYFPVIEDGKGEAKVAYEAFRQGNGDDGRSGEGFGFVGVRYAPMANLEVAAYPGYTLGARYQIIPVLSAGVDVTFPIPGTNWVFYPNAQFSTGITEMLTLGSNVGLAISTEDAYKITRGLALDAGVELDFAYSEKSTIWLSFELAKQLSESEVDGNKLGDNEGMVLIPSLGYSYTVGALTIGTSVSYYFGGEDVGLDPYATSVGIDAAILF